MQKNRYLPDKNDSESDDDSDKDLDVHEIVRVGSLAEVKEAISRDRPRYIALKDEYGRTVLHYAAQLNRERIALFLIAKNCDINARDHLEQTPLHLAAAGGYTEMCRFLLDFNANVKMKDTHCWTALHHAVEGNHYETATLLIKRNVDINAQDHRHGRTALHLAAEHGYSKMCEMLIVRGADLYASGDHFYSKTPLHIACYRGHSECVEVLVRKGCDVNALSGLLDKTPLHIASEEGQVECVKILLANKKTKRNIFGQSTNGYSPLHLACLHDRWHVVCALLEHASLPTTTTTLTTTRPSTSTGLVIPGQQEGTVSEKTDDEEVELVDINLPGRYQLIGATPLHIASQAGHIHIVHLLMDAGAKVEVIDEQGHTPLHLACKAGRYDVANMMIELGANFAAKSLTGHTPIDYVTVPTIKDRMLYLCEKMNQIAQHNAYIHEQRMLAEQAIQREKDALLALKAEKRQARQQRREKKHQAFVQELALLCDISGEESAFLLFLQSYGITYSDPVDRDFVLTTPEEIAQDDKENAQVYDINQIIYPNEGCNALCRACEREYYEIVIGLLAWPGILVNQSDLLYGNTPLHYAALRNHRELCEVLLLHQAENGKMNLAGQAPANMTTSNLLKELIRNQKLIYRKYHYQNEVSVEIERLKKELQDQEREIERVMTVGSVLTEQEHDLQQHEEGKIVSKLMLTTLPPILHNSNGSDNNNNMKSAAHSPVKDSSVISLPPISSPYRNRGVEEEKQQPSSTIHNVIAPVILPSSKYGPVPTAFGGCRSDLFFTDKSKNSSQTYNGNVTMDILSLQYSYTPTVFDNTAEWSEVKDFLWLLGYPYRHSLLQQQPTQPQQQFMQQQPPNSANNNAMLDKRCIVYSLAKQMNHLHQLFTSSTIQILLLHNYTLDYVETHFFSLDLFHNHHNDGNTTTTTNNVLSQIPKHLTPNDYLALNIFAHSLADFLKSFLRLYDANMIDSIQSLHIHEKLSIYQGEIQYFHDFHLIDPSVSEKLAELLPICDLKAIEKINLEQQQQSMKYGGNGVSGRYQGRGSFYNNASNMSMKRASQQSMKHPHHPQQQASSSFFSSTSKKYTTSSKKNNKEQSKSIKMKQHQQPVHEKTLADIDEDEEVIAAIENVEDGEQENVGDFDEELEENGGESEEETEERFRDPLKEIWSPLVLNPPRARRKAMDLVYELAVYLMEQLQQSYPTDAIRAHHWAVEGNSLLQQQQLKRAEEQRILQLQLDAQRMTALRLWLQELHLLEYEKYFYEQGFKVLDDFQELSAQDCHTFFPFLKIGDIRRIGKSCDQLSDGLVKKYEKQAAKIVKNATEAIEKAKRKQQEEAMRVAAAAKRSVAQQAEVAAVEARGEIEPQPETGITPASVEEVVTANS